MNKRAVGSTGEEQAAAYLEQKGYQIIERNYRNLFGEIDIIAEDAERTLIYCEVKYRRDSRYGDPLEAVGPRKQLHIRRTAACHYAAYDGARSCRFDVIALHGDGRIVHIQNAFGG